MPGKLRLVGATLPVESVREPFGFGETRLKMLAFLLRNPDLDNLHFVGELKFNVHNVHQNVTGQILPAAHRIILGDDPVL